MDFTYNFLYVKYFILYKFNNIREFIFGLCRRNRLCLDEVVLHVSLEIEIA